MKEFVIQYPWSIAAGLFVVVTLAFVLKKLFGRPHVHPHAKPPLSVSPNSKYSYHDFLRDIKDPDVSIDSIIDRCGGEIPKDWKQNVKPAPVPADHGPEKSQSPFQTQAPIDIPPSLDRLQRWFTKLAQSTQTRPVVAPPAAPAAPAPVVSVPGFTVPCKWCLSERMARRPSSDGSMKGDHFATKNPYSVDLGTVHCNICQNRGFVTIQRG